MEKNVEYKKATNQYTELNHLPPTIARSVHIDPISFILAGIYQAVHLSIFS